MIPKADDLTGKILIAMPGMGDPRFERSVVYLCQHSPEGALGLIVNKPAPKLFMTEVLEQLGIEVGAELGELPVYFGGPVETGRGFVLHSTDYAGDDGSLRVSDEVAMTASRTILSDIAAGRGPAHAMMAVGYSGWGPGQLEAEIAANGWLTGDPDEAIIFGEDFRDKWKRALAKLGIDPPMLSGTAGHA